MVKTAGFTRKKGSEVGEGPGKRGDLIGKAVPGFCGPRKRAAANNKEGTRFSEPAVGQPGWPTVQLPQK